MKRLFEAANVGRGSVSQAGIGQWTNFGLSTAREGLLRVHTYEVHRNEEKFSKHFQYRRSILNKDPQRLPKRLNRIPEKLCLVKPELRR